MFTIDLATATADVIAIGTALLALAVVILGFRKSRSMVGGR